jgi:hypothetical protein
VTVRHRRVLSRRRSLAYEIWLLRAAESDAGLSVHRPEPEAVERIGAELTSRLIAVERDLVGFPITYYFAESDARFSLPAVAPYLLDLGRWGAEAGNPEHVRLRANLLLEAVGDFARTTAARFHGEARGHARGDAARLRARPPARGVGG